MAAVYPGTLPVKTTAGANLGSNPHDALHNQKYEEVAAIAAELGPNVSGSSSTLKDRLVALEHPMTSYTPTISQGSDADISKTTTYSKYSRHGRLIVWSFSFTTTAAGAAGQPVVLTLPVAASSPFGVLGHGLVQQTSSQARLTWKSISTTQIAGIAYWYSSLSALKFWGEVPSISLESGAILEGFMIYEAAS